MNKIVQRCQVRTIDAEQIVCFSCKRPNTYHLAIGFENPGKRRDLVRRMCCHLYGHKGLNGQAEPVCVEPGTVAFDVTFRFQPLAASADLTRRKVKAFAQFL